LYRLSDTKIKGIFDKLQQLKDKVIPKLFKEK